MRGRSRSYERFSLRRPLLQRETPMPTYNIVAPNAASFSSTWNTSPSTKLSTCAARSATVKPFSTSRRNSSRRLPRRVRSLGGRKTGLRRGLQPHQARRSRRGVIDPHKEAVTTHCAVASPGPKGWVCKGAHASLRSRGQPLQAGPAPAPSLRPLADPTQALFLPPRLLVQQHVNNGT